MSKKSLLIVASLAYDGIETHENKVDHILGGAGSYICLSLKHFKANCSIVSVVGYDFEKKDLDLLESCGIDISGVEIIQNDKTFYWSCIYKNNFRERVTTKTDLNVMESFNPVIPKKNLNPDILLLGNLHPDIQLKAIKQLNKKPDLVILDTMNFWIENFWDSLREVIANSDLISINDEESEMITGEKNLEKAAEILHGLGPKYVIIKKAAAGAELFNFKNKSKFNAFKVTKVVDPTGAGDCFVGGIAGYLTQCDEISFKNIESAIAYGTSIASFNVESMGTKNLLNLSMEDIKSRINTIN